MHKRENSSEQFTRSPSRDSFNNYMMEILDDGFYSKIGPPEPGCFQKWSEEFQSLIQKDLREKEIKDITKEHLSSLATMMLKFFMSGAFWNGFRELALSYGYQETDQMTRLGEGLGDAFGVALGNFATEAFLKYCKPADDKDSNSWAAILARTTQYGLASLFAGWAWTSVVSFAQEQTDDNPVMVGLLTFLLCGGIFSGGLIASRQLISKVLGSDSKAMEPVSVKTLVEDSSLGLIKVGSAAASFTLTVYVRYFIPMIGQLAIEDKIKNSVMAGITTGPIGLTLGELIAFVSKISIKGLVSAKDLCLFGSQVSRNRQIQNVETILPVTSSATTEQYLYANGKS
jgi:hypothetical protein